jgi:MFS family permease
MFGYNNGVSLSPILCKYSKAHLRAILTTWLLILKMHFLTKLQVIAGVLVLPSFFRDFNLPPIDSPSYNNVTANIVSLLQIGGLIGSMATFPLMKYWGRKIAMMIAAVIYLFGAALQVRPLAPLHSFHAHTSPHRHSATAASQ